MLNENEMRILEYMYPEQYRHLDTVAELDKFKYLLTMDDGRKYIYDILTESVNEFDYCHRETMQNVSEEDWRERFSKKLAKRMCERNMPQSFLAEKSGVSRHSIGNYLDGRSTPSFYNVMKIARALGCSINELY